MKHLLIICILLCLSCNTNRNDRMALHNSESLETGKEVSLENRKSYIEMSFPDIPKDWEMITYIDGKDVIYNPCNKSNYRFKIEKRHGIWTLIESTGSEINHYTILNTLVLDNEIAIICKDFHHSYDGKIIFKINDYHKGAKKCSWSVSRDNFKNEIPFINENGYNEIAELTQPCAECWSDCK